MTVERMTWAVGGRRLFVDGVVGGRRLFVDGVAVSVSHSKHPQDHVNEVVHLQ